MLDFVYKCVDLLLKLRKQLEFNVLLQHAL